MPLIHLAAVLLLRSTGTQVEENLPTIQLKSEGELRLQTPGVDQLDKTNMRIGPGPRIAMLAGNWPHYYLFDLRGRLLAAKLKVSDAVTLDADYIVTIGMNPTGWTALLQNSQTQEKTNLPGRKKTQQTSIIFDRAGVRLPLSHIKSHVNGFAWTTFGLFDSRGRLVQETHGGLPQKGAKVPVWVAPGPDGDVAILDIDYAEAHEHVNEAPTPFESVRVLSQRGTLRSTFEVPSKHLYHSIGYDGSTVMLVYKGELRAYSAIGKPLWRSPIPAGKEYNEIWLLNKRLYALDEHEHILVFKMPSSKKG